MISVLILTLNEEANLPRCLASCAWCDDIIVLDSFSTDRTVAIAEAAGARVVQRHFDDWSSHLNWAVEHLPFRHPWVYYSDADEVLTPELPDELRSIATATASSDAAATPAPVAYRLRYRNYFLGRWIRHCGIYPVWVLRFFQPAHIRWRRLANPVPMVDGSEGRLQAHFDHYSFNKGFAAWIEKHNRYSSSEAVEGILELERSDGYWRDLFAKDSAQRRVAIRRLSFRLPCRPWFRFLYMYLYGCGFLDGRAGYTYCRLLVMYEYMIVLKMEEERRRRRGLSL